jgi:hypothetical protein
MKRKQQHKRYAIYVFYTPMHMFLHLFIFRNQEARSNTIFSIIALFQNQINYG